MFISAPVQAREVLNVVLDCMCFENLKIFVFFWPVVVVQNYQKLGLAETFGPTRISGLWNGPKKHVKIG